MPHSSPSLPPISLHPAPLYLAPAPLHAFLALSSLSLGYAYVHIFLYLIFYKQHSWPLVLWNGAFRVKVFGSKRQFQSWRQLQVQISHALPFKTFLHTNTLRNDKTTFQYSFLYFPPLLIAFLNYPVLFPTFPPTLQLRIITVRENGIYKKLLLILIDDTIASSSSCIHGYFTELSLWTSYNGYCFPSSLGLWGNKRSPKSGRWFPFHRTDYADSRCI